MNLSGIRKVPLTLLASLVLSSPASAVERIDLGTFTLLKVFDGARSRPNFAVTEEGRHLFAGEMHRFAKGDRVQLIEVKSRLAGSVYRMCLIDTSICSDNLTLKTERTALMLTSKELLSRSNEDSDLIKQIRDLQRQEAKLISQLQDQLYDY